MNNEITETLGGAAVKLSPPAFVSAATFTGWFELSDVLIVLTIVYTIIQIVLALIKLKEHIKAKRDEHKRTTATTAPGNGESSPGEDSKR